MTQYATPPPDPLREPEPLSLPAEPISEPEPVAGASGSASLASVVAEFVQTILLALVIFLLIRNVIQNFRIEGISMEPNFHDGQFLIINRFAYCPGLHLEVPPLGIDLNKTWCVRQPQRGDVIVFHYPRDPERDFIKRVIGLPGETVEIRQGEVYINGELLAEPFGPNPSSYNALPTTLARDEVYVMGDNRNNSSDSHQWGPLPEHYIVGKAWLSYWPPQYWSIVPHYSFPGLNSLLVPEPGPAG